MALGSRDIGVPKSSLKFKSYAHVQVSKVKTELARQGTFRDKHCGNSAEISREFPGYPRILLLLFYC